MLLDAQGVVTEPTHLRDEVVGGRVPRGAVGQFQRHLVGIRAQDKERLIPLVNNPGIVVIACGGPRLMRHFGAEGQPRRQAVPQALPAQDVQCQLAQRWRTAELRCDRGVL